MPHVSQAFTPMRLCRLRRLRSADGRCAYPCHRESWLALHDANTSRGGTPLSLGDPAGAAGWTAVTRVQTGDLLVLICCLFFSICRLFLSVMCSLQIRCRYDARPTHTFGDVGGSETLARRAGVKPPDPGWIEEETTCATQRDRWRQKQ
jgi:hypothetical protein